jgi:hypothetical protein
LFFDGSEVHATIRVSEVLWYGANRRPLAAASVLESLHHQVHCSHAIVVSVWDVAATTIGRPCVFVPGRAPPSLFSAARRFLIRTFTAPRLGPATEYWEMFPTVLFVERQMAQCAPPRLGRTVVVYAIAVLDRWPPVDQQVFWNSAANGEETVLSLRTKCTL